MVLCLAGHHPVLSIGGNARPAGPENNLSAPVPTLSRSHPSVAVWLLNCGVLNKSRHGSAIGSRMQIVDARIRAEP
jgi:hypothetical protein